MSDISNTEIARRAIENLNGSYAPYSDFHVSAVLEDTEGNFWEGANVENSVLGLTICAEQVAASRAINQGVRSFRKLVICTDEDPVPPCGSCRAFLAEFVNELQIYSLTPEGKEKQYQLSELYPDPFHLEESQ